MYRNLILVAFMIFVNSVSFAQNTLNDSLLAYKLFAPYQNYFQQNREWVYTHFNKSAYLQGDDVWFANYILNPSDKHLSTATTKLYVELWSPEKVLLSRKILFVEAGVTNHFIHLSDTLAPGTYCFRTYTNWMRNFYPENDFNTFITVLGHEKVFSDELIVKHFIKSVDQKGQKELISIPDTIPDYDIQFLPESGTFLEGVNNVFGLKAIDPNGKGVRITGKVNTADNQEITTFSTNETGMDKFIIPQATSGQYLAKVTLPDGTTRELQLPKTAPEGVIIHVYPYRTDVVWIKVLTNETTHQLNKRYFLVLHANGKLFNAFRFDFSKENAIQLKVIKKNLCSGIVCATVFDENLVPVAERIFYNQDSTARGNLSVKVTQLAHDSLNLNVFITDSLIMTQHAKLSISVLPGESHLNNFNNSLLAESVLRPALRGNIEKSNSYFEKNDFEHAVAIDNLFLTQGWRKYDWPVILKDTVPNFVYNFENGFTVEGQVKNWLRNKPEQKSQITLISPKNNLVLWAQADIEGKYKFDRLYLTDSTWVIASASNNKGQNMNRVLQMSIPESFMGIPNFKPMVFTLANKSKEIIGDLPQLTKETILLKEVTIKSKKKSPFADNPFVGLMDHTVTLTKENYRQFSDMQMLLESHFFIRVEKTEGEYHFDMGRGTRSISQNASEPIMMIDGVKVRDPRDILEFPIELVEAVAVNKSGFGQGMGGSAGMITIKSRTTPLFGNIADPTNVKRIAVNGYAPPVKYFEPKYVIPPTSSDYEKYATVFWKPDLVIDSTSTASFRFYAPPSVHTIAVRIEGISPEGKIFLREQKIDIQGRENK